jgi:AcrR family transcriptional regulator
VPHHNLDESLPVTPASLRNEPVQARSTARLTRLLDSAAEVIDDIGYERLTTAMVAERAGASIGTVYRYFPDRIAVLQSLSLRFLSEAAEELQTALADEALSSWSAAVDAVVDVAVRSFESKPGFRSLRFGDVIDVRPVDGDRTNNAVIASIVATALAERFDLDREDLGFRCEILVEIVDSLLARAFALGSAGDKRIIAEARSLARSYFSGFYGDAV